MIRPHSIDESTTERIQSLIRATFSGRDDLYTAADSIDNARLAEICRRLADALGGNAAELQQLVVVQGKQPAAPETVETRLQRAALQMLKEQRGNRGVVAEVEGTEQQLKRQYDEAIETVPNSEVKGVLRRHRDVAQFGEDVLHELGSADEPPATSKDAASK